jgi:hypothetical protein
MGRYTEFANTLKSKIEILAVAATDATASKVPELYPTLSRSGGLVKAGTRINWKGQLKIAAYDTYDREDTDPEHDLNGWTNLNYFNGYRVIPDVMTTTTLFHKGEIGWRADKFWQSLIDNNSWTPENYAQGWKEISI